LAGVGEDRDRLALERRQQSDDAVAGAEPPVRVGRLPEQARLPAQRPRDLVLEFPPRVGRIAEARKPERAHAVAAGQVGGLDVEAVGTRRPAVPAGLAHVDRDVVERLLEAFSGLSVAVEWQMVLI